ncbi:TITAN-like protein isoform X2 [Helianthus annuus]|uniref:TITAN-like protein isoform X2 n=1 Tax=Helianthus annuus TaxID=4232 RepID=UPI000B9079F9|nr:TITAN-like protein isoform X2 [Helianthus annuus]
MEPPPEPQNPNPSTGTPESHSNPKPKRKNTEFEFCKVCKLNHNQGRRHNFFPNHVKSLSSFLSRFQTKISDVRFFLKNPSLLPPDLASRNKFWCVFCDSDVTEHDSAFTCENGIRHLASADHLRNLKSFMWKYGGGMDQIDRFRFTEADLAKYEKKCISLTSGSGSEQSHGPLIGPSNDIHNERKFDYVDNFDRTRIISHNSSYQNNVLPLQDYTNEKYQVSHSDLSGHVATSTSSYDNQSLSSASNANFANNLRGVSGLTEGYHHNGLGKTCQVYAEKRESNGNGSSAGLQQLTQISSTFYEPNAGNVHSGAPPPWFSATNGIHLDAIKTKNKTKTKTVKSKLNPKRVGAAWAEKRKLEMEMEKRGALPVNTFDASWLPNFGRVWQSGSRKDSRKEFEVEAKKPIKDESQNADSSMQLQPYISKRMQQRSRD